MTQRSTTLNLAETHCVKALDYYEEGLPYDRDVFQTGVAAHAVHEHLNKAGQRGTLTEDAANDIANAIARKLVLDGRSFDGVPEPPLPAAIAIEGKNLAMAWWAKHGAITDPAALIEHGVAVDSEWNATSYTNPNAHLKAILDVCFEMTLEGDEGQELSGIVVQDAKTSWRDLEGKLDSIQLHGQALIARALYRQRHGAEPSFVLRQIANFRTLHLYEAITWNMEEMDSWKLELDLAIEQADRKPRIANPGVRCWGCPYLTKCEAARSFLRGGLPVDPQAIAIRYGVARAMLDQCTNYLKQACHAGPVGDIGYRCSTSRKPGPMLPQNLARAWFRAEPDEQVVGLLQALEPGTTSIAKVAKKLYPRKKLEQQEFVNSVTVEYPKVTFGVLKQEEETNESE